MQTRCLLVKGDRARRCRGTSLFGRELPSLGELSRWVATPISSEHLDLAVLRALAEGGFLELEMVRYLPGMTRSGFPDLT